MSPSSRPSGRPLVGPVVRLDRLVLDDARGLFDVFSDPACYASGYVMQRRHESISDTRTMIEAALADPGRTAYAIRLTGDDLGDRGTIVGTTSVADVDVVNEKCHIGWTMYGSRWWGTAVNPAAKLLVLGHVFEDCGMGRVRIQTDLLNTRSQAAIAKLGAVREGIARRDMRRPDGSWRDTVIYSILATEWPDVRDRLRQRIRP